MAKTVEEIIEVNAMVDRENLDTYKVAIYEIFCGFNQPKEKIVFSGLFKDIPENIRNLKYTEAYYDKETKTHIVKYTDHKSFEGKQLFRQMFLQQQGPI